MLLQKQYKAYTITSACDFLSRAEECEEWLNSRGCTTTMKDDHVHLHGVKRKNLFFNLRYWQVSTKL
jgi:hypothetical protein